eukprot:6868995-Ditylum_brightwellii.AAC.1
MAFYVALQEKKGPYCNKLVWNEPHMAYAILNPDTGKVQSYEQLITNPATCERWLLGMCKELGRLAQGYEHHTKGTNTVFFMDKNAIKQIPQDCTVTYACIVT